MITILHGDYQIESRKKRTELIEKARFLHYEILFLDGKSIELSDMVLALESQSLFSKQKLVVIDDLISSLHMGKKRDAIISYLISGNFTADIVLWEAKGVAKQIMKLKKSSHVNVQEFTMPKTIFSFVESLYPTNCTHSLSVFQKTVEQVIPEIIFVMIVRQFRLMMGVMNNADISEVKRLVPWQKSKILRQLHYFSTEQLRQSYKELLTIDYQIKTGKTPFDLTKLCERFIMDISFV